MATRITDARVVVTCPGRNFVTLRLETSDGLSGLGDATLNGRELAVSSYLEQHVIPCLVGRDPHRIEDTWQFLYRGAYWRRRPVTMTAIGAVDTALWDLKAKAASMPLYQLLGGACRKGITVYGHASGETVEDTIGEIFNTIRDCKQLIEEQLIDYIRATVVHAGGITHLRRIAAFADLHHVRTGCHGATDLSPVSMAASPRLPAGQPPGRRHDVRLVGDMRAAIQARHS